MARRRSNRITAPIAAIERASGGAAGEDARSGIDRAPRASRIGGYQVIAQLARGGTAGVYLAEHALTGERVALKVLDPFFCDDAELARRLLAERAVSERVRHPGLLDVMLADRSAGGVPYLVMEYLDGETLEARADRGDLDRDTLVMVAAQVAAALGALHAAGFVHCDVKPSNVLVLRGDWPRIKLIDYGVARRLDEPRPGDLVLAGTPAYMAPEQWRGEPCPASDVYALGCMLYELLTGRPVFPVPLAELMAAHCHHLPVRPSEHRPELPAELERMIVRALAKDPSLRPMTAELEAVLRRTACAEPLAAAG